MDANVNAGCAGFALEGLNALFEQLTVEIKPDGGDVSALLGSQQIACTSNLQIPHRNLESASKFGVLFHRTQPLARIGQQPCVPWQKQVGVCLVFVAPHSPPELVELAQSESICSIDHDGVGVWDINATFDNGRGNQNVCLSVDELPHDPFKYLGLHLTMANHDAGFWHEGLDA